jgi:CheY-like chemotaxis protein
MSSAATKKQILIVDRDVAAVEPLRQKLSEVGFSVRAITDTTAAVAAVAERPPHLVIIDWNSPGFSALELINGLRHARVPQAVRLIIISALAAEQDVVAGLALGADDYIAKPFSLREVVARVGAVLRSRRIEEQHASLSCDDLVLDATTNREHLETLRADAAGRGHTFYAISSASGEGIVEMSLALLMSTRHSRMLWASGFWQKTCLPILRANMVAMAWLWSGMVTVTASMEESISVSMVRKSL